jgi:1-acyl-sn-glycerol-3-phosphate acyltransferase
MTDGPGGKTTDRQTPVSRAARSLIFCLTYLTYLLLVMGPVQWLVLGPWLRLFPRHRPKLLRSWQRFQAGVVLGLARFLADVRVTIEGAIPPVSVIVVMNHQSLFDIPLAFRLITGPYPLVPTRRRYEKAPVISTLLRMAGHPFVDPGRAKRPEDRAALQRAVEALARGENSYLIFAEGHRSPERTIRPFETGGLRLAFAHAPERPVYAVLVEGFASIRTLADVSLRIAGTRARATVLGPFAIPHDSADHNDFIASLRQRMLDRLAAHAPASSPARTTDEHAALGA